MPLVAFTQQGLEKLNDLTTMYFHSVSNYHDIESLEQILQKQNYLESLENCGYHCMKWMQKCSVSKLVNVLVQTDIIIVNLLATVNQEMFEVK